MSPFSYKRLYQGKLQAVILDWAGTTMDFGCMAPAVVFMKVFENAGVPISMEEARIPMGAHKKVHIRQISQLPSVQNRWLLKHGRQANENDIENMFQQFIPLQLACLSEYSALIPGALDTVSQMRKRGLKIGSTTGYTKEMMDILFRDAKNQGYEPDSTVCACEVPAGRPYPFMVLQNMIQLQISPVSAAVKIDDTTPGVEEGLNAGCWTIGLAVSGNEIGLSLYDWQKLAPEEKTIMRARAYEKHLRTGAHYVVDSIVDVIPCLDDIERRLARGEQP